MLKKSFAAAALCLPAMAMAGAAPSFHYTVAANVTAFNPIDLQVTLTVENAEVKQYASMATWNETIVTPCAKFAAHADRHAQGVENSLGFMKQKITDKGAASLNRATLDAYEGWIGAEKSAMDACQKSASPSPAQVYASAGNNIKSAQGHLKAIRVLIPR